MVAATEEAAVVVAVKVVKPASLNRVPEEGLSIQIFRQETSSGVVCIINGGKIVTFVLILPTVHGRTSQLHALTNNEVPTNPAK